MTRQRDDAGPAAPFGSALVDDHHLWRKVAAGVRPLRPTIHPTEPPKSVRPPENEGARPQSPPAARTPRPVAPPRVLAAPELRHGEASGIDKRTLNRLRRGLLPVEGELDLHGCTQEAAHRRLLGFLAAAQAGGRRCVLVITGRGRGSDTGGVLKAAVPGWLNEAPCRSRVLAFSYAQPLHGGDGALYVLLRRVRA